LTETGDKIDAGDKDRIETALREAEEALKSGNKETVDAKAEALAQASHKLAEKMYADQQTAAGAGAGAGPHAGGGSKADDADVVDAEFEEVKDRK
jgi:molecular chaperone DnaK